MEGCGFGNIDNYMSAKMPNCSGGWAMKFQPIFLFKGIQRNEVVSCSHFLLKHAKYHDKISILHTLNQKDCTRPFTTSGVFSLFPMVVPDPHQAQVSPTGIVRLTSSHSTQSVGSIHVFTKITIKGNC